MSMDTKTTDLIEQSKNGDSHAFEELILNHEKIVFNIAYRMMKNPEDVKDISQDVFIKVYNNLHKFDGKSTFSTWVYRIAVNTCIDEIRKRKGKETYSIDDELETDESFMKKQIANKDETPEEQLLSKESSTEILSAMNTLSPEHKAIITLRDIQGFSYSEITDITGVSIGTVKSRLARGRLQLKNILLKNMEQPTVENRQKGRKEEVK